MAAGENIPKHSMDLYVIGLLSGLDAIGPPLATALDDIGATGAVRKVLLNEPSAPPMLCRIYQVCLACESADRGHVIKLMAGLKQIHREVAVLHYASLNETCAISSF